MMARMTRSLEDVFQQFCTFGAKGAPSLMDGAKFAKLCKDMKLLDKNLSATDVDIIFAKSKPKSERKITYEQFEVAVGLLAEKKYPGVANGLERIRVKLTSGSGPSTHGATKVVSSDVVERMTDTAKYTGAHKHRFDEEGKGRGLEGRDSVAKGRGMVPGSVASQTAYVPGYKHEGTYSSGLKSSPKSSPHSSPKPKPKADILDRLTDSSKYTGTHKHRFDDSGRGKGLEGRDSPATGAGMSPGSMRTKAAYVTGYKHEGTYGKKK